ISESLLISLSMQTPLLYIAAMFVFLMFGIALVVMPLTTAGINSLPPDLIAHGTAMMNTIRMVGGSIGTAILISVMSSHATASDAPGMLEGMHAAYIVALAVAVVGFIASFILTSSHASRKASSSLQA